MLFYSQIGISLVAQMVKNLPAMPEARVWSLGQEDPLEKGWLSTPVFLPGEFHGQRSLEGYSPWDLKELDTIEYLTLFFFFQVNIVEKRGDFTFVLLWSNLKFCLSPVLCSSPCNPLLVLMASPFPQLLTMSCETFVRLLASRVP